MYMMCGWIVAAVSSFFVFIGPRWMYLDDYVYDKLEASFYAGLHRQIFAASVSWLIFCCAHGYGGKLYFNSNIILFRLYTFELSFCETKVPIRSTHINRVAKKKFLLSFVTITNSSIIDKKLKLVFLFLKVS